MQPRDRIAAALARETGGGAPSIVAFVTAGYPDPAAFASVLEAVAGAADAVEIGVPFSDPMADGVTIQRSSRSAIEHGVNLHWILDRLEGCRVDAPLMLMSYLNPLLAFGYDALAERAAAVGVAGFLVPDLPLEESAELGHALDARGLALVQFVTPATPSERRRMLCDASGGFVYAVTKAGITGGESELPPELAGYLDDVKRVSRLPVCAGFGVRDARQVELIGAHCDGVIVGSALVEVLERGDDPAAFLHGLKGTP